MPIELIIPDRNVSPPGGYEWTEPSTGGVFKHFDWIAFSEQVRDHRLANNIPLSPTWQEELISELCQKNAHKWRKVCRRAKEGAVYRSLDFGAAMTFGNLLKRWLKEWLSGSPPFVEQSVAEDRARICAGCPNNRILTFSCGACMSAILSLVALIVGKRKTSYDDSLGACLVCSCALKPAVHVPLDVQQAGLSDALKEEFRKIPYCWKRESI